MEMADEGIEVVEGVDCKVFEGACIVWFF